MCPLTKMDVLGRTATSSPPIYREATATPVMIVHILRQEQPREPSTPAHSDSDKSFKQLLFGQRYRFGMSSAVTSASQQFRFEDCFHNEITQAGWALPPKATGQT